VGVRAPVRCRRCRRADLVAVLGFAASIPNLSFTLLVAHLLRGAMLGVLTRWGYGRVE
jgi:hypothetical protein